MLTAIIIDDEPNNLESLSLILGKHCPGVTIAGTALSAAAARKLLQKVRPDIVFLDIQMPHEDGFAFLRSLPAIDFDVVFVTAYDQHGIQAIKLSALDYLLKPVIVEELKKAVTKAESRKHTREQEKLLRNLMHYIGKPGSFKKLGLPAAKETKLVNMDEVIRCESSNSYTTFHLRSGEKIVVCRPIKEYEELLTEYGFFRAHQSHLVNKTYIKSLLKTDGFCLLLIDGSKVPLSRHKKEQIIRELNLI